jgi:hypothetical protein
MRDFWLASGHRLARPTEDGRLAVTDALLLAWLARPELVPPEDACADERALYARLRAFPAAPVAEGEVAALADADARENWAHFIRFRDRLLAAGTVEQAYLDIVRTGAAAPPIFLDQLAHLIMRAALDGCEDPFTLRAAELFWRAQRASVRDEALVLADAERVRALEAEAHANPLGALFGIAGEGAVEAMNAENAATYWDRSDAHDFALPFGAEPRAREGLAASIAAFLRRLLGLEALVEPLASVEEPDLRWYVGLDREGTAIGDALWRGSPAATERLVGLFRLRPAAPDAFMPELEGRPVYLLMGMDADATVRLKPQNLVMGLPYAERAADARRATR